MYFLNWVLAGIAACVIVSIIYWLAALRYSLRVAEAEALELMLSWSRNDPRLMTATIEERHRRLRAEYSSGRLALGESLDWLDYIEWLKLKLEAIPAH